VAQGSFIGYCSAVFNHRRKDALMWLDSTFVGDEGVRSPSFGQRMG